MKTYEGLLVMRPIDLEGNGRASYLGLEAAPSMARKTATALAALAFLLRTDGFGLLPVPRVLAGRTGFPAGKMQPATTGTGSRDERLLMTSEGKGKDTTEKAKREVIGGCCGDACYCWPYVVFSRGSVGGAQRDTTVLRVRYFFVYHATFFIMLLLYCTCQLHCRRSW